jgi:hypothetical protein
MSNNDEDLEEKKLLGSGGYAIARLTEAEEIKVNLGVHHLFLGNIGRLAEDRFLRYYCNKCEMEHDGCPLIIYEVLLLQSLFFLEGGFLVLPYLLLCAYNI